MSGCFMYAIRNMHENPDAVSMFMPCRLLFLLRSTGSFLCSNYVVLHDILPTRVETANVNVVWPYRVSQLQSDRPIHTRGLGLQRNCILITSIRQIMHTNPGLGQIFFPARTACIHAHEHLSSEWCSHGTKVSSSELDGCPPFVN